MLEGVLCQSCGALVDEMGDGDGYPRNCADCDEEVVAKGLPGDDEAKKAYRRKKAKGQRWRKRHRDALVSAAMRFGADPSPETLRVVAMRAAEFGKLYRSKQEAKEIVSAVFDQLAEAAIEERGR
jgi:ketosteroid isomerase-like protein